MNNQSLNFSKKEFLTVWNELQHSDEASRLFSRCYNPGRKLSIELEVEDRLLPNGQGNQEVTEEMGSHFRAFATKFKAEGYNFESFLLNAHLTIEDENGRYVGQLSAYEVERFEKMVTDWWYELVMNDLDMQEESADEKLNRVFNSCRF